MLISELGTKYKKCKDCKNVRNTELMPECVICIKPIIRQKPVVEKTKIRIYGKPIQNVNLDELYKKYANLDEFVQNLPEEIFRIRCYEKSIILLKRRTICFLRDSFKLSFPQIGKILHFKDHTSALYHYYKEKKSRQLKNILL